MGVDITSLLGGSLATAISDIIGKFKADPNKVLDLQQVVAQNQSLLDQKQLDIQEKLDASVSAEVQSAAANIQAEAKSGDKYTSRARPTFMYIVEGILAFNYIVIPVVHACGVAVSPFDLPTNLLGLFGICITGYTAFRSFDKLLGLPGDSNIQLGPVKVGNKS